jgi:hypothetical protein
MSAREAGGEQQLRRDSTVVLQRTAEPIRRCGRGLRMVGTSEHEDAVGVPSGAPAGHRARETRLSIGQGTQGQLRGASAGSALRQLGAGRSRPPAPRRRRLISLASRARGAAAPCAAPPLLRSHRFSPISATANSSGSGMGGVSVNHISFEPAIRRDVLERRAAGSGPAADGVRGEEQRTEQLQAPQVDPDGRELKCGGKQRMAEGRHGRGLG